MVDVVCLGNGAEPPDRELCVLVECVEGFEHHGFVAGSDGGVIFRVSPEAFWGMVPFFQKKASERGLTRFYVRGAPDTAPPTYPTHSMS